jgi:His-Xaa-Ser system protein HxsD
MIEIDESVFPLEVVLKATYWLSGRYSVDIRRDAERGLLLVEVTNSERSLTPAEQQDVQARLRRDLIDFRTRLIIDQETRTLRELLVAKAFAHGDEY